MRVLAWLVEDSWKATIAATAAFAPADADITLLHVRENEAESLARGALHGLLGRPHPRSGDSMTTISEEEAQQLLDEAATLLARQASAEARSGNIEREVLDAAQQADLLVLARDGSHSRRGPRSLGPGTRFAIEHAPGAVLVVWPD